MAKLDPVTSAATPKRDAHKLIVGVAGLALGGVALWQGFGGRTSTVGGLLALLGIFMVVDAIFDLRSDARQRDR
jgi:hypothetical protein